MASPRVLALVELHRAAAALQRAHGGALDAGDADIANTVRSIQEQVTATTAQVVERSSSRGARTS